MEALLAVRRGGVLPRPLRWTRGAVCGGTHGSRPTLYYFVGQGPRTLPGVRWLSGGRGKAPPLRSVGFAGPGDRTNLPYGFTLQKGRRDAPPFLISGFITPGYPWPRPWGRRTRGRTCCRRWCRRQGRCARRALPPRPSGAWRPPARRSWPWRR